MGLEREKYKLVRYSPVSKRATPGVRSFGFMSLTGAFIVALPTLSVGELSLPMAVSLMLLSFGVIGAYTVYRLVVLREGGVTASIALGVAYAIGVIAGMGLLLEAVAVAVFSAFALAVKLSVEKLIRGMTYRELILALEIGVLVFFAGPFIPEGYDPLISAVNFRMLYLFFVVVLAISYLGYALVKTMGPGFIRYFSALGGLVHSEATTVSIVSIYGRGAMVGELQLEHS